MEYRVCNRCVMDTKGDPSIKFDKNGNCNYCNRALAIKNKIWFPNDIGEKKINELFEELKRKGKGKEFDCFMGISGGLDSSYLAYMASIKYGLRIMAVHIDDGFNTDMAENNIRNLVDTCGINLINVAPDEEQFNEINRAFLLSGVPNIAIPQDNVLFSSLYKYAIENGIDTFLSGDNFPLESILQKGNTHTPYDLAHIHDINKRFGRTSIDDLPLISSYDLNVIIPKKNKITTIKPLNFINYNKENAIAELTKNCGFQYYGGKHWESSLTKFLQTYYLYNKFGVDKRKSHLSSLVISNQMTREEALEELKELPYDKLSIQKDIQVVCKKLDISENKFNEIMSSAPKCHKDYKTSKMLWMYPIKIKNKIKSLL